MAKSRSVEVETDDTEMIKSETNDAFVDIRKTEDTLCASEIDNTTMDRVEEGDSHTGTFIGEKIAKHFK